MTTTLADISTFPRCNGFARRVDLDSRALQPLRAACLEQHREVTGKSHLFWSRQWEYPYGLANLPDDGGGLRILDAGSGFGFFALELARRGFEVHACDLDGSAGARLAKAAATRDLAIQFRQQDLALMNYPEEFFDYVACVSVLEHTADPLAALAGITLVLRPGGRLVLTFDVSIDGDRNIPLSRTRRLLEFLEEGFEFVHPFADQELLEASALNASDEVLKSQWFREHQPHLLPWSMISRTAAVGLLRGQWRRPFFNLAVMGLTLTKKKPESA